MKQTTTFTNLPKLSTNEIYSGKHWRSRQKHKQDYLWLTQSEIKKLKKVESKVNLEFVFYFKSRAIDSSNCAYMAKILEDCLVHYKIIENDDIKCVGQVSLESRKSDNKTDYCVLNIATT